METPELAEAPQEAAGTAPPSPATNTDPGVARRDDLSRKILNMTATESEKGEFGDWLNGTFNNGILTPRSESPASEAGPDSQTPDSSAKDPEPSSRKEKYTSGEVTAAFGSQFEAFDNASEEELTPQEQADRDLLREIKAKTIDKNKKSFTNKFTGEDGTGYSQREYLPVETLLKFAEKRLEDPSLLPETRAEISEQIHVLIRHSKTYADINGRVTPDGHRYSARVIQESKRIDTDPRLEGVDPEELQTRRRELIIPPKRQEDPPIQNPPDPPEDPDPDPIPDPPPIDDVRREFYIVNRTVDIRKRAAELAETAVQEEQKRGSMLNPKNWIRKTKMRVGEEYYRQQYMQRAIEAMTEHNNSYLQMDLVKNAAVQADAGRLMEQEAGKAKIEQLREQDAEGIELEGQILREARGELKTHILDQIIKPAVDGTIADVADAQRVLREFISTHADDPDIQEVFGRNTTEYGVMADYFATDLLDMARVVKEDLDANKYAVDQLHKYVDVKLAYTDWAAEGRAKFTRVDRIIAGVEKRGLKGRVINPATVGAAFSLGVYGTMRAAGIGGKAAAIAVPGAGALSGALFSAARRSHDLKVDRASHNVEMAYNSGSTEGLKRREKMEQYAYDTASFDDLTQGGRERSAMGDNRGIDVLLALDASNPANQEALIRRSAEILTRLDYSASQSADLITFTSRETVEQNRLQLVKKVVEARQKLRGAGVSDDDIEAMESDFRHEWTRQLIQNTEQQDRAFRNYRLRSSLASGIYGGATGLAMGLGVKEAIGLVAEHTPVGSVVERVMGSRTPPSPEQFSVALQNGEKVKIGGGELSLTDSGQVEIIDAAGEKSVLNGAALTPEGSLTLTDTPLPPTVEELLDQNGFTVDQATHVVTETVLDTDVPFVSDQVGNHTFSIPQGTELIQNPSDSTKWDLVVSADPSRRLIEGMTFNPAGELVYDSDTSLADLVTIDTNEHTIVEETERIIPVTGEEGVLSKEGIPIQDREWYAYDTAESEKNELQLLNGVFTASNGEKGVIWDMSSMQEGYQSGANPNSIDVQQVIRDGQAGFAFSFADSPNNPIWVSDLSDGVADGKIILDPTSTALINPNDPESITIGEFSKIVLNQNALKDIPDGQLSSELTGRQNVFNLGNGQQSGFIEAGRLIDTADGQSLQTFATATGTGGTPNTITTIDRQPTKLYAHQIKLTTPLTEAHDQTVITITPPAPEQPDINPPLIPIPMSPRFPLESLKQKKSQEDVAEDDQDPQVTDTFEKYSQPVPVDEKSTILNKLRISGGAFGDKALTPDILRAEGLEPLFKTEVQGIPVYFSKSFTVQGGRQAVIAYTEKDGEYTPRTYYRSNSQGVWRYLPAYTRTPSGSIDWYHKGYGEESLTLPAEIQEALATIDIDPARSIQISEPEFIFAGTARENRRLTPDMTYVIDTEFAPISITGTESGTGQKLDPESIRPADPMDEPEFGVSEMKWDALTPLYGAVHYETVPSKNKKYRYIFCRNAEGKVWIGGIEGSDAIGGTGLRKKWVKGGDLTTPAYEYNTQAGRYGNIQDRKPGGYVDMYENYISRIPMIQDYLISRGLKENAEEETISTITPPSSPPIRLRPTRITQSR